MNQKYAFFYSENPWSARGSVELKRLDAYKKRVIKEMCEPYLYLPKYEALESDMASDSSGAQVIPLRYGENIYFAVMYKNDALPFWLDDNGQTRLFVTDGLLNECRFYDFGLPSFFNLRAGYASAHNIKMFWNIRLSDARKCQIEFEGAAVTGTLSNIEFTKFDLSLDVMPEFKKHIEFPARELSEHSFIQKKELSEYAVSRAKEELLKLYLDYKFFFIDHKEKIIKFFDEYFAPYQEELRLIKGICETPKRVIKKQFSEGQITQEQMEAIWERRRKASERKAFIVNENLEKTLREWSLKNLGREIKYQKYFNIINNHLLSQKS